MLAASTSRGADGLSADTGNRPGHARRHAARSRWKGRTARKAHMSYSKDREAFVHLMSRYGFGLSTLRAILRHAGTIQRAAEVDCSVSNVEIRVAHDKRASSAEIALRSLAVPMLPANSGFEVLSWRTHVDGDPRGYVVSMIPNVPPNHRLAEGVCVPAQGYSASQMARMTGRA